MPTRFDVERAVIASALPASARLIILTLAAWTDNDTAAIPPDRRKSLDAIAQGTGLGKTTVCRQLDQLELAGWLQRRRTKGGRLNARTGYRLLIGAPELPDNVQRLRRETVPPRDSNHGSQTVPPRDSLSPAKTSRETVPPRDSKARKLSRGGTTRTHSVQVGDTSAGRPSAAHGTRLPDDWQPSPELLDWAYREHPRVDVRDQTDRFRDYWHAKAGAGARHVDWDLTWKNWIRKAGDDTRDTQSRWLPPEAGRWE